MIKRTTKKFKMLRKISKFFLLNSEKLLLYLQSKTCNDKQDVTCRRVIGQSGKSTYPRCLHTNCENLRLFLLAYTVARWTGWSYFVDIYSGRWQSLHNFLGILYDIFGYIRLRTRYFFFDRRLYGSKTETKRVSIHFGHHARRKNTWNNAFRK